MKTIISGIRHQRDIKVIRQSQLFDENFYLTHYPHVKASGLSPIEHFVKYGSAEGLQPNAFFDTVFYRDSNPDVKSSSTNPLVHFIKFGATEGRNPCRKFDIKFYLSEHPDVAKTGANPLWHFLTYGVAEQRETNDARGKALSAKAGEMYEQLAKLEPFLPPFEDLQYARLAPVPMESLSGKAYFKLAQTVTTPFTHLLVVQRLMLGGAATLTVHYANLIAQKLGVESVLVLLADESDQTAAHLLPEGMKMVVLDELQPGLSTEEKVQVLTRFVIESRPQLVHNLDSNVCWQMFQRYHQSLRPATSLAGSLFMFTYNNAGRKAGFASSYLNRCINGMDVVLTDNLSFKRECIDMYGLEPKNQDKMAIVYTPILSPMRKPEESAASSKRILWSSRLHPDKRPDLLLAIAQRMPDYTFEIYGGSALSDEEMAEIKNAGNINLHGPYKSSSDLPSDGIGAYLHTAKHEGGAITMKEAIVAGLPAVGPPLGLISDILTPDTGWLVTDMENPDAYVAALRACQADPKERMRRILNAQDLMQREHSWNAFAQAVSALPAYRLAKA